MVAEQVIKKEVLQSKYTHARVLARARTHTIT